jgi:uncharacterized membrane protein
MKTVEDYLRALDVALTDTDPALVRDALSDAEEHLRLELEAARRGAPEASDDALLPDIVARYGEPDEIAAAYVDADARLAPAPAPASEAPSTPARQALNVFVDGRAYASIFYLLLSFVTGIIYFVWVVTGLSLSLALSPLIVGIPFFGLFLLSTLTLALLEGRLIEALTGERMPRRSLFDQRHLGWWGRLKHWLGARRTWTGLIYLLLQLPLGVFYLALFVALTTTSLALIASPILEGVLGIPHMMSQGVAYYFPTWTYPLLALGGVLLLYIDLQLARLFGGLHARWAKLMLV